MELNKLVATIILVGATLSSSAYADRYVFGYSEVNSDNGLNITTTAGNFFVHTSSSGWWDSQGTHDKTNTDYIAGECCAGECCPGDKNHSNFFTFDLSGVTGSILSASLILDSYGINAPGPLNYSLFDITSPLPDVRATGNDLSIYKDLMSGSMYGSFSYTNADAYKTRSIALNSTGISALNSAVGGEFGIGGSVAPPIPEPENYAMLLAGLGLLGWRLRNRFLPFTLAHCPDLAPCGFLPAEA